MILGEIQLKGGVWVFDAMPHVMLKVRPMLTRAHPASKGTYTDRPLWLSRTPDNAKDLLWISSRYPMVMDDPTADDLRSLADVYDQRLAAASLGDKTLGLTFSKESYELAEPPRDHQSGWYNFIRKINRSLLGDDIGLGKTYSALMLLCEPDSRPAIAVVPPHLTRQWERQAKRFLPGASTHIIRGHKQYSLPSVDLYIIGYTGLYKWQDVLDQIPIRLAIFDEVQDLRHTGTEKRRIAQSISARAETAIGLSATPIYNYGGEIWSVIDVLNPGVLGRETEFKSEWCAGHMQRMVTDPLALRSYLTSAGLMLRRTKRELGMTNKTVSREVVTLDGDLQALSELQEVAKTLAMTVLSSVVGESEKAQAELDWRLRQATGIAKAKAVAEAVRLLVESGEQVVLFGWHHAVYDVWMRQLKEFGPVLYTGGESPAQKDRAKEAFLRGDSKIFICSLRSGAGIDGLQDVCCKAVFGELDWSPQVMEQCIGRLDREGQANPVDVYFMVIDDGSDPFILETLSRKQSQSDGILDGAKQAVASIDSGAGDRLRRLAESYLASIGEAAPTPEPTEGLYFEVLRALRQISLPTSSEADMQSALASKLPWLLPDCVVEREVKVSSRSRIDFVVHGGNESIAIECKVGSSGRSEVYRQVRRYANEAGVTACILLAPWSGVKSFVVDGIPVTIVDWSKQALRVGSAA